MNKYKLAVLMSFSMMAVACGGGGSSDDSGGTPAPPVSYTVTASAGTGGSISPSSRSVVNGQTTTFSVTTDDGYNIDQVTGCNGSLSGSTYTTGAIIGDCSVEAAFEKLTYTITIDVVGSGAVSSSEFDVDHGDDFEFTTIPEDGHGVYEIEGCAGVYENDNFISDAITEQCEITVTFEPELEANFEGSDIFLKTEDETFKLEIERDVEIDWSISTLPEGATVFLERLDEKEVSVSADFNGDYALTAKIQRGYLSLSVEHPFKVATPLSENVEEDRVLLLSESPYMLTQDIFIRQEKTLSAEPGVEIYGDSIIDQFNRAEPPVIDVFGTLDMRGSINEKILFSNIEVSAGKTSSDGPYYFIRFSNVMFEGGVFHSGSSGYGHLDVRKSAFLNVARGIDLFWPYKHTFFVGNSFVNSGGIRFLLNSPKSLFPDGEDKMTIENNIFVNPRNSIWGDHAISTYGTSANSFISVQNNSFYTDGKVAVRVEQSGAFDAPNNYWGTTDEDVIKAMIWDMNDDPALTHIIEFRPFLTEPHPDTPVLPEE